MNDAQTIQRVFERFLRHEISQEQAADDIVRILAASEIDDLDLQTSDLPILAWLDDSTRDDARAQALVSDISAQLRGRPNERPPAQPSPSRTTTDDIVAKAKNFWRSAGRKQLAHYLAAEDNAKRHRRIGIPSVILSTMVATSIFSTLSESVNIWVRIATGFVALLAAIGAALQTWLAFGERAEKHRMAGAKFGKVRYDLELFQLKFGGPDSLPRDEAIAALQSIGAELGSLESDSPTLSNPQYDAGQSRFDQTHPLER